MNNDLISRSELKKAILEHRYDYVEDNFFWTKLFDIIDNAPTVPLPDFKDGYKQAILDGKTNFSRPQGEWIIDGHHRRCKKCGEYFCMTDREGNEIPSNFCPNCGDMKGGAENG